MLRPIDNILRDPVFPTVTGEQFVKGVVVVGLLGLALSWFVRGTRGDLGGRRGHGR